MILDFAKMEPQVLEHFKGGEKALSACMYSDGHNRILYGKLIPGASIGMHTHEDSSEIIYLLSGDGTALIGDGREELHAGMCHYCPLGERHSLINTGSTDLVFFAVVPQQ